MLSGSRILTKLFVKGKRQWQKRKLKMFSIKNTGALYVKVIETACKEYKGPFGKRALQFCTHKQAQFRYQFCH